MTMASESCLSCGAGLPSAAKFCVECGNAIGDTASSTSAVHTVSGLETVIPNGGGDHEDVGGVAVLKPGDVVAGKFEIERIIGQGGMGVVYKAQELISGNMAALKVIGQRFVGSSKAVQRLIDEGTTTRGISHPNVVQIYDIGLHGSQPYIAMEYVDGKPLHVWRGEKMASGEPVPIQVAAQIVKEILNGLEAAHGVGVIHRDLKPENIMLLGEPTSKKARVKIVDFGIALATKTATDPGTGTGLGTQLYMAPEQIRNADAANASADLYSLSKIFYELIVGVLPTGHWQPPSGGRADVLPQVDALIEKGLSANRDMRPQTAADYRAALISAMNGNVAKDEGKASWHKTAVMIGGAVLALIVVGALFSDVKEPPSPTSTSTSTPTPTSTFAYFSGTWADPFGGAYRINVSRNGDFRGSGRFGDGTDVTIVGKISNQELSYSLGFNGQVFAEGTGRQTDQCHFNFTTGNYATGEYTSGVFHVNHSPGDPCP